MGKLIEPLQFKPDEWLFDEYDKAYEKWEQSMLKKHKPSTIQRNFNKLDKLEAELLRRNAFTDDYSLELSDSLVAKFFPPQAVNDNEKIENNA